MASSHKEALAEARTHLERARVAGNAAAVKRALKEIERARHALCEEAEKAAQLLIVALEDQNRLSERVMAGVIPPEEANRTNRHLSARINEIRSKIAEINATLATEQPVEAARNAKLSAPFWATPHKAPDASARRRLRPTARGFVVWLVCMILGVMIPLVHFGVISFSTPVQISVVEKTGSRGEYSIVISNFSRTMLRVIVPYLKNAPQTTDRKPPYGLRAQLVEKDSDFFRSLPDEVSLWSYLGSALVEPAEVTIPPEGNAEFGFSTGSLDTPTAPAKIRFLLVRQDGRVIAQIEE